MQKTIVVTGCSKKTGVGYHLVNELLARGHRVIATVRHLESSELQIASSSHSKNLSIKTLDLCEIKSIQQFTQDVLNEYGYIDVLVNNAADVVIGAVETVTQQDMQVTFQTKVFGPVALIQAFLPCMRAKKQGLLIATSSMFCAMPFAIPGFPIYLSALCAFERICEALAIELLPWHIHVVNFQCGPLKTNLTHHEGSRHDVTNEWYKNFLGKTYDWYFKNLVWQNAEDIVKDYADVIEKDQPDFTYQSSAFARDFVKQYRTDVTGDTYRDELSKIVD